MTDREPIEGIDYYFENGLMVFTAQYLRDRGYCCTNGCRHCPYGYERNPAAAPPEAMLKEKSGS
ncbi:MAG TPA: DUF5522 domain-containing protein [Candidatus Angelobacter sp.]|nr:DUF5522 domain-containing protein [Candidatus Angelobacter sp.]